MRIVGEIVHPSYKITIFKMNERLSVKIEDKLLEQIYKFRDGMGVYTPDDVEAFLTDGFMKEVDETFVRMRSSLLRGLEKKNNLDDYPNLI